MTDAKQLTGATDNDPILPRSLSLPRNNPQYATSRLPQHIVRQTNLPHHPLATEAPGIWHITCRIQIDDFSYGQITRMVSPRSGLRMMSRLVWAVAPGLIERSAHLVPWFRLLNCVCFDRFSACSLPFAGAMRFLIGAIGGWPPPSEYHMVERQVNNVTGGGAVGVPAQQV